MQAGSDTFDTPTSAMRRGYARVMDNFLTPADLSRELGVDQRALRAYLRKRYGALVTPETRWRLNDVQAEDVRDHLRAAR